MFQKCALCVLQKCSGNAKAAAWALGWCMSIIVSTWNCGRNKQGGLFLTKLVLKATLQHFKSYAVFFFSPPFQAIESYLSKLRWCLNMERLRKRPLHALAAVFKAALLNSKINWVFVLLQNRMWFDGETDELTNLDPPCIQAGDMS